MFYLYLCILVKKKKNHAQKHTSTFIYKTAYTE